MKKILTTLMAVLALTAMVVSCGGGDKQESGKSGRKRMDLPTWYAVPPTSADAIYAVGYAKKAKLQLAQTIAASRARDELSRVLGTKVTNMTKDFIEEGTTGTGKDEIGDATEFSQSVSKQLTDNMLSGSTIDQQEFYELDDGNYEVFVLIKLGLADFGAKVDQVMKANAAAFAKLQATKALDELSAEIANLRGDDKDVKAKGGSGYEEDYED
ncbi:MAG: LPP20 family lipoprotein [Spirochaetales bacterium]|nr:LPP20 family lipoprotein [Spirochaetales bacterium]